MNECQEIIKWHPQLILISKKPMTWYGLLNINSEAHIIIKLKVPEYPRLKNAKILFDGNVSLTHGTDFTSKVSIILKSANSIMTFLIQLQKLLDNIIKKRIDESRIKLDWCDRSILDELKSAITIPDVTISASDSLNLVSIKYKNISMTLQYKGLSTGHWVLISSDLPKLQSWSPLESCVSTLTEAVEVLKSRTNALNDTWEHLHYIDEQCWVLDPVEPKPHHLHRRIFLSSALSLLITFEPANLQAIPELKVLGSEDEVTKCKDLISDNLEKWTDHKTVVENLLDLLELSELPKPTPNIKTESDGIFSDKECCICFANEGDDGQIPSIVCNNEKCRKYFHNSCLQQWLQVIAESSVAFNRIRGSCPNCKAQISCPLIE